MNKQVADAGPCLGMFAGMATLKLTGATDVSWWVVAYPLLALVGLVLVANLSGLVYRWRDRKDSIR